MKYNVTFSIYARELKAAALFASREAARYIMNGVLVEIWSKDRIILIGTDGKTLAFVKSGFGGDVDGLPDLATGECIRVIVPLKMVSEVRSSGSRILTIGLSCDGVSVPQISIKEEFSDVTKTAKAVYGMFPNVRSVIMQPQDSGVRSMLLAPRLLSRFAKAIEMLTGKNRGMIISPLGTELNATVITSELSEHFFGLIMPLRDESNRLNLSSCPNRPAWV